MGNSEFSTPMHGFRVLACETNSPSWRKGFVPWFDWIIGVLPQHRCFEKDDTLDRFVIRGEPISLLVYNTKIKAAREIKLIPDDRWGGRGLLGLLLEACQPIDEDACRNCIRITRVFNPSPAASIGLEEENDYLLGCEGFPLQSLDDFTDVVRYCKDSPVDVFVFNSQRDSVRVVRLSTNRDGFLGVETAIGILHEIPYKCRKTLGMNAADDIHATDVLVPNSRVQTPNGMGFLVKINPDGSCDVRLDWDLGPGVECLAHVGKGKVTALSSQA
jgi:hypothetical protein